MTRIVSSIAGFAIFWYRFIIGDDWRLAAAVVVALAVTATLLSHGVQAWWLVPAVVILSVAYHLRRVSTARR